MRTWTYIERRSSSSRGSSAFPRPGLARKSGRSPVRFDDPRAVGSNLCEAWARRRYPAHFLSKLTDCDGELSETKHWLRTAEAPVVISRTAIASTSLSKPIGSVGGSDL
ncbi:MAG: four helix bundle protein [Opitutaceae bacterium]